LKRDDTLDMLRGIGLLCIMLAHVGPPAFLFQLRNFDVPLMVLVAGSSFAMSTANGLKTGYIEYIIKRLIRLVIPTWTFLSLFFLLTLITSFIMQKTYPFPFYKIFASFFLGTGIGYVWIIRVFLLISLIAPLTRFANASYIKGKWSYSIVFTVYLIYEFMVRHIPVPNQVFLKMILDKIVYMAIPYGCIFFLGTRILMLSCRQIFGLAMVSLIVCTLYAFVLNQTIGGFAPVQDYKYPPTAYYISYGLSIALLLFWISRTPLFGLAPFKNNLAFFGRSSMWIYLWHIQVLYWFKWMGISIHFTVKYIIVAGVSAGIIFLQTAALNQTLIFIESQKVKKLLTSLFT